MEFPVYGYTINQERIYNNMTPVFTSECRYFSKVGNYLLSNCTNICIAFFVNRGGRFGVH